MVIMTLKFELRDQMTQMFAIQERGLSFIERGRAHQTRATGLRDVRDRRQAGCALIAARMIAWQVRKTSLAQIQIIHAARIAKDAARRQAFVLYTIQPIVH